MQRPDDDTPTMRRSPMLWRLVLAALRRRYPEIVVDTWLARAQLVTLTLPRTQVLAAMVCAACDYDADHIDRRFADDIRDEIRRVTGKTVALFVRSSLPRQLVTYEQQHQQQSAA